MNTASDGILTNRLVATGALALYSTAVVAGCIRVFFDWSFFGDLMLIVAVGHGVSLLLHRVNVVAAIVAQAAVLAWLLAVILYPDSLSAGLPSATTWDVLTNDLRVIREEFPDAVAPVGYANGWASLTAMGVAIAVLLGDVFAFRARTRFEALVPGGVLFVVIGALGSGRHQLLPAMAMVLGGVLAIAALRSYQVRPPHTLVGRAIPPLGRIALGAVPLGVVAALVSGLVGPALPGADSEALYDPDGEGSANISSPLVDIRSRLVDQSDTVMFTVESNEPAYWRVATLSQFNGASWHLSDEDPEAVNGLFREASAESRPDVTQRIEIGALTGRLVPNAAEPYAATGSGLLWSDDAAALYTEEPYGRGDRFEVESVLPRFSASQLAATSASNPPDPVYLTLPDRVRERVGELGRSVTEGARNDYEQALLLQNWFLTNFEYDLTVRPGISDSAIGDFLQRRSGYCEQFAGTYAAMARALDMPSRVATGYTQGDDTGTGSYTVRGRHAHAWPEVWFDGLGWVAFEPTPGRGAPGADHTGLAPQQAMPGGGDADTPASTTPSAPTAETEPTASTAPEVAPGQRPDDNPPPMPEGPRNLPADARSTGGSSVGETVIIVVLAIVVLGAVAMLIPRLVRARRRERWRAEPRIAVSHLWSRVQRLYAASGLRLDPARTPSEFARVAARMSPGAATEVRALAAVVNQTLYADADIDRSTLERCEQWYHDIARSTSGLIPWPQRLWMYLTSPD